MVTGSRQTLVGHWASCWTWTWFLLNAPKQWQSMDSSDFLHHICPLPQSAYSPLVCLWSEPLSCNECVCVCVCVHIAYISDNRSISNSWLLFEMWFEMSFLTKTSQTEIIYAFWFYDDKMRWHVLCFSNIFTISIWIIFIVIVNVLRVAFDPVKLS